MTYTPCLTDIYHGNQLTGSAFADEIPYFKQAISAGRPLLMHKLSQGSGFCDPLAKSRLTAFAAAGGLCGGYHFWTATDTPEAQVGCFMKARGAIDLPLVLALDFEPIAGTQIAEQSASMMVNALRQILGEWPLLYTGRWSIAPIPMDNLPSCPVWLAEYKVGVLDGGYTMPAGWDFPPTFIQYTDGTVGESPGAVPGIGVVDQSAFNGTVAEAVTWWQEHKRV